MPPRRILVTGATGFIGAELVQALRRRWPDARLAGVYIGDRHPPEGVERMEADICELGEGDIGRIRQFDPDTVYHAAGIVRGSLEATYRVHVGGTARLMMVLEPAPSMERVILTSSTSVYGPVPPADLPVMEDRRLEPANDYAISKLAQELIVQDWCRRSGWCSLICRISNPIGPGQSDAFFVGRLVRQFAAIAAGRQEPRLELWHLAGSRDFVDIRDVSDALAQLAVLSTSSVVNVGGGQETPLTEVFRTLEELTDQQVDLVETREPDEHQIVRQQVDVTRLGRLIGAQSLRPLRESLAAMLDGVGCRVGKP
jgi:nucleoside-diphosphate-sugar epimerase